METKHTPGPWALQDDTTFSTLGDKRIVAANRISPAIAFGGLGEETDANARLIAAAPELLVALKTIEAHHVALNEKVGRAPTLSETLSIARAAIAKAEGKE